MTIVDRRYSVAEGTAIKAPCRCATTANITLSGAQTIDGIAVTGTSPPTRVLVKDQSTASQNGIYDVSTGNWTRTRDFDGAYDVVTGTAVYIAAGSVNARHTYLLTTTGTITIGTTSLTFEQDRASEAVAAAAAASASATAAAASAALSVWFSTKAAAQAATVGATTPMLALAGYTTRGDAPVAWYTRVAAQPSHAGKLQTADGAWWELADRAPSAPMFGAVPDDSTDNQTALAAWIAACDALNRPGRLPKGIYRHSGTLTVPSGVSLYGDGGYNSILKTTSATANQLTVAGSQTIRGIGFASSVTRTAGTTIKITVGGVIISDFRIIGPFTGIEIVGTSSIITIEDGEIRDAYPATGNSIRLTDAGAAIVMERIVCDSVPDCFSHLQVNSTFDLIVTSCDFIRSAAPICLAPGNGQGVFSVRATNTFFDTAGGAGIQILPTGTGAVYRSDFVQCWGSSAATNGAVVVATGATIADGISFRGCHFLSNGTQGFYASGVGVKSLGITDCEIAGNLVGVELNDVTSARITSGRIGNTSGFAGNTLGIKLTGTTDNVYIDGVDLRGNTTVWTNTASGTNIVFGPCFGAPASIAHTPTVTSDTGAITTVGAHASQYSIVGKMCHWQTSVTITTNGTGAGHVRITLPFTSAQIAVLQGVEMALTGKELTGLVQTGNNYAVTRFYDGSYPGANGAVLVLSGEFEMA